MWTFKWQETSNAMLPSFLKYLLNVISLTLKNYFDLRLKYILRVYSGFKSVTGRSIFSHIANTWRGVVFSTLLYIYLIHFAYILVVIILILRDCNFVSVSNYSDSCFLDTLIYHIL